MNNEELIIKGDGKSAMKWRWPFLYPLLIILFFGACVRATPAPPPQKAQKKWSVAVMAFEDHSIGMSKAATAGLGQMLADKISERIIMAQSDGTHIRLVDRDSLQKILEELKLGSSEIADSENRLRLGKLLGANYFIMGGFTAIGGTTPASQTVRIDGRIVAVETGEVEGISVDGKFSDWATLEDSLSKRLVNNVGARHAVPLHVEEIR
jgi:TolB-like protein